VTEPLRYQEAAAVRQARRFLLRLADHRQTRRIPRPIRAEALALLRTMPTEKRLRGLTPDPLNFKFEEN
jgi:hypothetical protein